VQNGSQEVSRADLTALGYRIDYVEDLVVGMLILIIALLIIIVVLVLTVHTRLKGQHRQKVLRKRK
jgi:hypothetical protein